MTSAPECAAAPPAAVAQPTGGQASSAGLPRAGPQRPLLGPRGGRDNGAGSAALAQALFSGAAELGPCTGFALAAVSGAHALVVVLGPPHAAASLSWRVGSRAPRL